MYAYAGACLAVSKYVCHEWMDGSMQAGDGGGGKYMYVDISRVV